MRQFCEVLLQQNGSNTPSKELARTKRIPTPIYHSRSLS